MPPGRGFPPGPFGKQNFPIAPWMCTVLPNPYFKKIMKPDPIYDYSISHFEVYIRGKTVIFPVLF